MTNNQQLMTYPHSHINIAILGSEKSGKSTCVNNIFVDTISSEGPKTPTIYPKIFSERGLPSDHPDKIALIANIKSQFVHLKVSDNIDLEQVYQDIYKPTGFAKYLLQAPKNLINSLPKGSKGKRHNLVNSLLTLWDIPGFSALAWKTDNNEIINKFVANTLHEFDIIVYIINFENYCDSEENKKFELENLERLMKQIDDINVKYSKYLELLILVNKCDHLVTIGKGDNKRAVFRTDTNEDLEKSKIYDNIVDNIDKLASKFKCFSQSNNKDLILEDDATKTNYFSGYSDSPMDQDYSPIDQEYSPMDQDPDLEMSQNLDNECFDNNNNIIISSSNDFTNIISSDEESNNDTDTNTNTNTNTNSNMSLDTYNINKEEYGIRPNINYRVMPISCRYSYHYRRLQHLAFVQSKNKMNEEIIESDKQKIFAYLGSYEYGKKWDDFTPEEREKEINKLKAELCDHENNFLLRDRTASSGFNTFRKEINRCLEPNSRKLFYASHVNHDVQTTYEQTKKQIQESSTKQLLEVYDNIKDHVIKFTALRSMINNMDDFIDVKIDTKIKRRVRNEKTIFSKGLSDIAAKSLELFEGYFNNYVDDVRIYCETWLMNQDNLLDGLKSVRKLLNEFKNITNEFKNITEDISWKFNEFLNSIAGRIKSKYRSIIENVPDVDTALSRFDELITDYGSETKNDDEMKDMLVDIFTSKDLANFVVNQNKIKDYINNYCDRLGFDESAIDDLVYSILNTILKKHSSCYNIQDLYKLNQYFGRHISNINENDKGFNKFHSLRFQIQNHASSKSDRNNIVDNYDYTNLSNISLFVYFIDHVIDRIE